MARSSEAMARRRPVLSGWRLPTGRGGRVARCRWSDGPRQEKAGRENGWRLLWWSLWRGPAPHHGAVPSRRTMVPWSGVVGWVLLALPSRAGRASQGTARPGVGGCRQSGSGELVFAASGAGDAQSCRGYRKKALYPDGVAAFVAPAEFLVARAG